MKKFVKIIIVLIILINVIFMTKSYGICNTIIANKRISAVRLTLANGQVLCSAIVDQKDIISDLGTLDFSQVRDARSLDLIFIIDTDTEDLNGEKAIVEKAISNFSTLYTNNPNKLNIGIIGFNDEYKEYSNSNDFEYEVSNYGNDSEKIQEELDNISAVRKFETSNRISR